MENKYLSLTIKMNGVDPEKLAFIWESLKGKDVTLLGEGRVVSVGWGHVFKERDMYQEVANAGVDLANDTGLAEDGPELVTTEDGKTFHSHPFGVYSTDERNYDGGEWYTSLDELSKKYEEVTLSSGGNV